MKMDKALDLNGHTVNAYVKYYSEVGQGYLISIRHKDARLTIRDSVGGGALIGEFNQEFYFQFIDVYGGTLVMESGTVKMLCPSKDNQYLKCAISVSGTAVFNGGEVLTQVTSPGGEREKRYLSRRLQAIRGEAGGSVTINGGTFDRVVLHSAPTPENRGKYELVVNGGFFRQSIALILTGDVYASNFDHLPMQINDAYFMRTTDKLDPCRLVIGGKLKTFYDNNWDYDIFYNDIPGATLDDALSMMDDLIPHGVKIGAVQYIPKTEFISYMASPKKLSTPRTEKYKELIKAFKYKQRREHENEQRRCKRKMESSDCID